MRLLEQFTFTVQDPRSPVLCREGELREIIRVLCRREKNSPALVGPPGVGKTALVEELARRIRAGAVPHQLSEKRLLGLNMASLVAGTKYRGEFEERVRELLTEAAQDGSVILFIDELHTVMGAGGAEGAIDAANLLKPALSRGRVQVIGATTDGEYHKRIETDPAMDRRFRKVRIPPTDPIQTRQILEVLSPVLERHHRVTILPEALDAAVDMSRRYLADRSQPDSASDLLDEAAASVCLEGTGVVSRQSVAKTVQAHTGIPLARLTVGDRMALQGLEQTLARSVIGQEEAIKAVSAAVRRGRSGICEEGRPSAAILLTGPTGVGKTALCKALAEAVYGRAGALIRLDMSEFGQPHTASRLIGAAPGYVGHGNGGELTKRVREQPYSLVLFDELEKAHPEVQALLLQILEDGRLTDSCGQAADFRNTLIVMTSNAGEDGPREAPGFCRNARAASSRLRSSFSPELLGRMDAIVRLRPLEEADLAQIAALRLRDTVRRAEALGLQLSLQGDPAAALAAGCRGDSSGARALRRQITEQIESPLADFLLAGITQARIVGAPEGLRVEAFSGADRVCRLGIS
ncbi:MAG: ATP-dependent Clp protease ATP-binding subunit [Oscillospiraceae bacterium]|nr:ATP-dependent Clp protease ATP-binding subunit [Oscillospiraceae bacterium]